MYRFALGSCLLCCALGTGPAARADLLAGFSVGSGGSTASLLIDFGFDGGDAYLFAYHFDGAATSEDMLLALDGVSGMTIDYAVYDFGGGPLMFVNGFTFDGNSSIPDFVAQGTSWDYYLADEPIADPPTWSTPAYGVSGRSLSDGAMDGWRVNISEYNELGLAPTADAPSSFSAAEIAQVSSELQQMPEPSSAALLALAGGVLGLRRRP